MRCSSCGYSLQKDMQEAGYDIIYGMNFLQNGVDIISGQLMRLTTKVEPPGYD